MLDDLLKKINNHYPFAAISGGNSRKIYLELDKIKKQSIY